MALSGDGLFSKARNAADKYKKAQEDEAILIDEMTEVRKISTAEELQTLAKEVNEGNTFKGWTITLMEDIDLTDKGEWTPIGTEEHPFEGTLEGNYHKIDGITIDTENNCQRINRSK